MCSVLISPSIYTVSIHELQSSELTPVASLLRPRRLVVRPCSLPDLGFLSIDKLVDGLTSLTCQYPFVCWAVSATGPLALGVNPPRGAGWPASVGPATMRMVHGVHGNASDLWSTAALPVLCGG